eukprot:Lankesteria_metandrocarpae@DN5200_c0_g1_i20.p1
MTCLPKGHPNHVYRETLRMGRTRLSHLQVIYLVEKILKPEWPGPTYHILKRNCINFADQFCCLLGVGSVPSWLKNLQNVAGRAAERLESTAVQLRHLDEQYGFSTGFSMIRESSLRLGSVFHFFELCICRKSS